MLGGGRFSVGDGRLRRRLVQLEHAVHGPQGRQPLIAGHQHGNLDFAGGDHQDVHAGIGQSAEHLLSHARLLGHAQPYDRHFRDVIVVGVSFGAQFGRGLFDRVERGLQVVSQAR